MGADYFSGRIAYPSEEEDNEKEEETERNILDEEEKKEAAVSSSPSRQQQQQQQMIWVKVWDTPGRERYSTLEKKKAKARSRYATASFSDNFLRNVDAAVLVYDVSSSTSFTMCLKWHSELMERLKRMEANGERIRPLPILIVGNKIDIFQERDTEKDLLVQKNKVVEQRSVLNLQNHRFRGDDYRYEFELSTYMGTKETSYLESILNNEVYRGAYLDSLLSSEDKSHPDKDMVLLWCMRNGLKHMDVSAKTGTGINELIQQLIQMSLDVQREDSQHQINDSNSKLSLLYRNNKELDLHQRYAPKPTSCFRLPFQRCCKP
ncbi:MAG: hypothetical protein SGARI_000988 [Bacillariaceae sp.]